jgi:hypothetical protein
LKNTTLLCAVAAVAVFFAGQADAIYKCTTPKGVVYQDRPCKEGAESDVSIVTNATELGLKAASAQDDPSRVNAARTDGNTGAARTSRANDDAASMSRPADNRASSSNAGDSTSKRVRTIESVLPMSADEARRTDPTAKYYTTDAAAPGTETPGEMTCESPNGEKRRFILSNGKLTSI